MPKFVPPEVEAARRSGDKNALSAMGKAGARQRAINEDLAKTLAEERWNEELKWFEENAKRTHMDTHPIDD